MLRKSNSYTMKSSLFKNLKYDIPAGIVVFLVAVPLCLGIALASGAPLFSGIIAGMVGGIVVTLFSGSQLGVSGPAAGLAVIVLAAIEDLGTFEIFLTTVLVAGIIQLILGFARAGIIAYFFPTSVIKGMLSAIGIIIFMKQIPHAFGYDKDPEGELSFFQPDGETTLSELSNMLDYVTPGAMVVAAISLTILILWEQKFMKKIKLFQVVQGPLVVVVMGIILGIAFQGSSLAIGPEHMVSIPVADDLAGFFGQFTLPDFSAITRPEVLLTGAIIALVASLETLLCVEATDKLDPEKRVTSTNRELIAQGVGNLTAGLIGGLPVTQVIVRSSANIQSGGKSKFSALFHGFLILICAMAIPGVLNMIPYASLAGILFIVGYKLAKPALFKQMYREGLSQFIPFVVTVVAIYLTDLLVGIGIGLAVGIFYVLKRNYQSSFVVETRKEIDDNHFRIMLSENVSFLNKASIRKTLDRLPENSYVLIDGSKSKTIEHDVLEVINDFKEGSKSKNITLHLCAIEHIDLNGFDQSLKELVVPDDHKSNNFEGAETIKPEEIKDQLENN